jgi:nicotinate-nucleotide adenylyltransferase
MQKIGLLGGTFDPVHNGHLIISEYLRVELNLEQVWFIPTNKHPLKNNKDISSSEARLQMLNLAIAGNPYFKSYDYEVRKEGISFTIETLRELKKQYQSHRPEFYFFIGMDNVNDLPKWKDPEEILQICQVVAFGRPGFQPSERVRQYLPKIKFIQAPLLEISSSIIRNRVQAEQSIRYMVPDSVREYITEKKLYQAASK